MPKTNPLVKICGLTSEEQALQVAKLGANAIGIISVKDSPRYVSCLLYTSPSPRDLSTSRMPSSA